jgi:low temperature requirement protein LtrA
MLVAIWWMYDAFAWLTNAMPPDRVARQLFLLGGMVAFFVMSLAIPRSFARDDVVFAAAYLVVVMLHAGLYVGASAWPTFRAVLGFARFNATAALLILAAAIAGEGAWRYGLWIAAVVVISATPWFVRDAGDPIRASHFVERHGLVVIVALGESVVAVGIGASNQPITLEMIAVAALGLTLSACFWWTYFAGDEVQVERSLAATPVARRARIALNGFYYSHLLILLGVIAVAAALEQAIGHAFDALDLARALSLGGGTAAFVAGDALFCRSLRIGHSAWRLAGAGLAVATIPVGIGASALAQLAALVVGLGACLVAEARA